MDWINQANSSFQIAGHVSISVDLRCVTDEDLTSLETTIKKAFDGIAQKQGVKVEMKKFWESKGMDFNQDVFQCILQAATEVGCEQTLVSSVGHDSVYTSRRVPSGMLFTRCKDGVSHSPDEFSTPEDCATSAEVMLGAYLRYDQKVRHEHS